MSCRNISAKAKAKIAEADAASKAKLEKALFVTSHRSWNTLAFTFSNPNDSGVTQSFDGKNDLELLFEQLHNGLGQGSQHIAMGGSVSCASKWGTWKIKRTLNDEVQLWCWSLALTEDSVKLKPGESMTLTLNNLKAPSLAPHGIQSLEIDYYDTGLGDWQEAYAELFVTDIPEKKKTFIPLDLRFTQPHFQTGEELWNIKQNGTAMWASDKENNQVYSNKDAELELETLLELEIAYCGGGKGLQLDDPSAGAFKLTFLPGSGIAGLAPAATLKAIDISPAPGYSHHWKVEKDVQGRQPVWTLSPRKDKDGYILGTGQKLGFRLAGVKANGFSTVTFCYVSYQGYAGFNSHYYVVIIEKVDPDPRVTFHVPEPVKSVYGGWETLTLGWQSLGDKNMHLRYIDHQGSLQNLPVEPSDQKKVLLPSHADSERTSSYKLHADNLVDSVERSVRVRPLSDIPFYITAFQFKLNPANESSKIQLQIGTMPKKFPAILTVLSGMLTFEKDCKCELLLRCELGTFISSNVFNIQMPGVWSCTQKSSVNGTLVFALDVKGSQNGQDPGTSSSFSISSGWFIRLEVKAILCASLVTKSSKAPNITIDHMQKFRRKKIRVTGSGPLNIAADNSKWEPEAR